MTGRGGMSLQIQSIFFELSKLDLLMLPTSVQVAEDGDIMTLPGGL